MDGAGNDFILVDARRARAWPRDWRRISQALCDRHGGIGADGLLLLETARGADARMRIFNPDGSEAAMCGNGARCVARYVKAAAGEANGRPVTIETRAGRLQARVRGARVAMRLTDPAEPPRDLTVRVGGRRLRVTRLDTGVPHAVVFVPAVARADVLRLGRALRRHSAFGTAGTNVDFVEVARSTPPVLRVRTYERGVEAETRACGTGMAAAAIAAAWRRSTGRRGRAWRVEVRPRSGDRLIVTFTVSPARPRARVQDVVLEGPARRLFAGTVSWPLEGR
jgi:diaminopimelate epimerase